MKIEDLFDIWMALLINFTKFELSKSKFLPYAKKQQFLDHFSELQKKDTNLAKKYYIYCCGIRTHTNLAMKLG